MAKHNLTEGNEMKVMLLFSLPLIAGNLLQQLYNIVDTLIVGKFIGAYALAAVGSSYTLMVFLTSINLGLCVGSSVVFAQFFGARNMTALKTSIYNAFIFIFLLTLLINFLAVFYLEPILRVLNIQPEALPYTKAYLQIVLRGILFTFIYNFFAAVLRSIGNSLMPLVFLAVAAITNIILDILFVLPLDMGIEGAAYATVLSQAISAVLVCVYCLLKEPSVRLGKENMVFSKHLLAAIGNNSILSSMQQSIMNFGILMIQGLVNSFGITAMAAFAAAVKIDTMAHVPIQDFGNGFSTYVAQNKGAGKPGRILSGIKNAAIAATAFCILISAVVCIFAKELMLIFVLPEESEVIAMGVTYLRIEGFFYCLLGYLFIFYSLYRGIGFPAMSVVLTVISLGIRVLLAYTLAPTSMGLLGIWWAIPIGWFLADATGLIYLIRHKKKLLKL